MCIRRKSRIQTSTVSDLERISIIPHSSLSEPVTAAAAAPSSRLLKRGISARERLRQYRQKQSQQQEKPG
ncbi:MAG: hypothetical protein ACRD6Q_04895 [Nitrososphaeraceae archaeon]